MLLFSSPGAACSRGVARAGTFNIHETGETTGTPENTILLMTSPACRLAQRRSQPSSKPFAPEDKQPIVARATSHDESVGIRRRV